MDIELVKKLQNSATDFLKGMENLALLEKSLRNRVDVLEERKITLNSEITSLQSKLNTVDQDVKTEAKATLNEIENHLKEIKLKSDELTRQIGINQEKQCKLDLALREAQSSKANFDRIAGEHASLVAEIKVKKAKMEAAISA